MSVVPKNLRTINSLGQIGLARRMFIERGVNGFLIRDISSRQRGYPRRVSQVSPQQRHWNSDYKINRPLTNSFTRYAAPQRRNNILTAQNAAKQRRYQEYDEMYMSRMSDANTNESNNEVLTPGQATSSSSSSSVVSEEASADDTTSASLPPVEVDLKIDTVLTDNENQSQDQKPKQMMSKAEIATTDTDEELRSVRETLFGSAEEDGDDSYLSDDLLKRVSAQKSELKDKAVCQKVSSPYSSYVNHRLRWAEFRHGMIYGRSSF